MKFEQSRVIADLKYVLTLIENPELELPDELLEALLKRSYFLKKQVDKFVKSVYTESENLIRTLSDEGKIE